MLKIATKPPLLTTPPVVECKLTKSGLQTMTGGKFDALADCLLTLAKKQPLSCIVVLHVNP